VKSYGTELILDLHWCDSSLFNRRSIRSYFIKLCRLLGLERQDLHFWYFDDPTERAEAPLHLAGISAIQFITTSNITLHALDKLHAVYINIFSCSSFDVGKAADFSEAFFKGKKVGQHSRRRGLGVYEGVENDDS